MNPDQSINENITSSPPAPRGRKMSKKAVIVALVTLIVALLLAAAVVLIYKKVVKPPATGIEFDYGSVLLSNGNEVSIGQPAEKAATLLGYSKTGGSVDRYDYPSVVDLSHPLEATIFINEDKVTAIRVNRGDKNRQTETSVYVGMSISEIQTRFGSKLQRVDEQIERKPLESKQLQGYLLKGRNSESYYLTNTCLALRDIVSVFIVAKEGSADRAKELGAGCNNRGN